MRLTPLPAAIFMIICSKNKPSQILSASCWQFLCWTASTCKSQHIPLQYQLLSLHSISWRVIYHKLELPPCWNNGHHHQEPMKCPSHLLLVGSWTRPAIHYQLQQLSSSLDNCFLHLPQPTELDLRKNLAELPLLKARIYKQRHKRKVDASWNVTDLNPIGQIVWLLEHLDLLQATKGNA